MIELKDVTGGYHDVVVIRNISMNFKPDALNVIIGPNGCGKSTLMRIAAGLLPPQSGEVQLDGASLSTLGRQGLAQRISYLPQSRTVPDISVEMLVLHGRFPHLAYPRRYRKEDIIIAQQAMVQMGIVDIADKRMNTLSGGERQKVYIAMMLAQDGDVIFMDEPATYLDISHQLEVMDILLSLKKTGKTPVVILHDLNLAMRYADRIFVMKEGSLLYEGDSEALFERQLLENVFGVEAGRMNTGKTGIQYYFI